jgi:hypothetical protein
MWKPNFSWIALSQVSNIWGRGWDMLNERMEAMAGQCAPFLVRIHENALLLPTVLHACAIFLFPRIVRNCHQSMALKED